MSTTLSNDSSTTSTQERPAAVETIGLRMFGWEAEVRTDVATVAAYGRDLFARFAAEVTDPAYRLEIVEAGAGRWHVRDGTIDGEVDRPDWLNGIVAARILENVANAVDDRDVFHGAGLAKNGRGLIVCGESGHGKSTTTLALLRRGWGFLTDECATLGEPPLADDAPVLHAFPKALEIRPGSPAIEGLELDALGVPRRGGKLLIDPDTLFPGSMLEQCPLHAIVFLASAKDAAPATPLELLVHRREEGLIDTLRALDGVDGAEWIPGEDPNHPTIRFSGDRASLPLAAIEDACGKAGVLILAGTADAPPPERFNRVPTMTQLDRPSGIHALMSQFRGQRAFARRVEQHGGFPQLFVAMLERFRNVQFTRLEVGHLDQVVEQIESLFD